MMIAQLFIWVKCSKPVNFVAVFRGIVGQFSGVWCVTKMGLFCAVCVTKRALLDGEISGRLVNLEQMRYY